MTTRRFAARILGAMASILLLDGLWLGLLMGGYYREQLGSVVLTDPEGGFAPRPLPTLLVYILIPLGIALFTRPAQASAGLRPSLPASLIKGAVFGLVLYGTYDMTNWSLLSAWTPEIAILDTLWGVLLCGLASVASSFAERYGG
jgi:uncharacterized membrane protein